MELSVDNSDTINLIDSSLDHHSSKNLAPLATVVEDVDIEGIADTGCTTHIVIVDAPLENIEPTKDGLAVNLPDGRCIRYTHRSHLMITDLPLAARVSHVFS